MEQTAEFLVRLADLESGFKEVRWEIPAPWLAASLSETEATPTGKTGSAELTLTKTPEGLLVQGKLQVEVQLPCAETLDPAIYQLEPEVFLDLKRVEAEREGRSRASTRRTEAAGLKPSAGRHAASKHQPGSGPSSRRKAPQTWASTPELASEQAGEDTFAGDQVALDSFLREFILLDLPMLPLREDLRSGEGPAIGSPPSGSAEEPPGVDPRLMPLLALRERLNSKKE